MATPSFTLRYFPVRWRAEGARFLLLASGAAFEEVQPAWPAERDQQPLGQLPVLVEHGAGADGSDFVLSDSVAIERYLAARAGLLVRSGPRDTAREDELRAHMEDLYFLMAHYVYGPAAGRPACADRFRAEAACFVRHHERVLAANGANGHYFGAATTFADISLFLLLLFVRRPHETNIPGRADFFSEASAPGLNRVYQAVLEDPIAKPFLDSLLED